MPSSAPLVKAALVTQLGVLYPAPTLVSYGDPAEYQPEELVSVMGQHVVIDRPTSGTNRPREEMVETTVEISVYVGGSTDVQQIATERAYVILSGLQDYFKTKPNETLGGACREALVTAYDLTESLSLSPDTGRVTGQVATIAVIVTSHARI